ISSGIYGYPKDQALQIAISAISEFLMHHEMMVYLVVYDKSAFALSEKLFSDIEKYIDDHYVEAHEFRKQRRELEPYEFQQMSDVQAVIVEKKPYVSMTV
ncbi:MAG TPA: RNase III inhibitor, partial [Peptococcaceae bacterium]|nr:RNase III inhibitor [Peptococcaceae bacterium]